MTKYDQMTSNERMAAFYSGQPYDRVPVMLFIVSNAGKYAGMTHKEKRSCAQNQAAAQIAAYERMHHDGLVIEYGLFGVGRACGSLFDDPEDAAPSIVKHVLNSFDELDKLDLSMVERKNDPWLQLNYDAASICLEKVGKEVGVSATIPGPLTSATTILPLETVMKGMLKKPEKVHELLRFCTDAAKIVIDEMTAAGCGPFLCDPIASESLINDKAYREFVFPYTKELMEYVQAKGMGMGYHVCGEANKILDDMVKTGCGVLSFDTQVDLEDAKRIAGDRVTVLGNIDVIHTLFEGTPKDVEESVKTQLRKGYDSPKGFALSVSCDIPVHTPLENIDMIMECARKYGKMPLDTKLFL